MKLKLNKRKNIIELYDYNLTHIGDLFMRKISAEKVIMKNINTFGVCVFYRLILLRKFCYTEGAHYIMYIGKFSYDNLT